MHVLDVIHLAVYEDNLEVFVHKDCLCAEINLLP